MSQRDFAATIGVGAGRIGSIETDADLPSRAFLQKISERYGISADWLLNGVGERQQPVATGFAGRTARIEPPDIGQADQGDFRFGNRHYAMVRRMDLSVSAGSGVVPIEGADSGAIALPTAWLTGAGINSDLAVLVRVKGDSMAPGIPDGAFVMVHLPEKQVDKPGIYAFSLDDQSFVKRLIPSDPDTAGRPRTIMILSDNPACQPSALTGRRLNELRIVGRVRAVLAML